jgi:RNA ligase (TIGR02306 family)
MRKLASIQEITNIKEIPKADKIEVATVLGWKVVVRKDEFKIGDKVVYIEIDSKLPPREEFSFLKDRNYKVKTIKLRGQISQGIIFNLSILKNKKKYEIGDDVTDELGIKKILTQEEKNELQTKQVSNNRFVKYMMKYKWFRNLQNKRTSSGKFPVYIVKTDETRCQNMEFVLKNKESFIVTEKIDGQSGTWVLAKKKQNIIQKILMRKDKYEFIVCSRNIRKGLKFDGSSYWHIAKKYNIEKKLKNLIGKNQYVAIQGEVIGVGIQKNKYCIDDYDMYVFNYIVPGKTYSACNKVISNILSEQGFKTVPVVDYNYILPDTIDELVEYSIGKSVLYNTQREGIVLRNNENIVSFKCINPEFLLKNDE